MNLFRLVCIGVAVLGTLAAHPKFGSWLNPVSALLVPMGTALALQQVITPDVPFGARAMLLLSGGMSAYFVGAHLLRQGRRRSLQRSRYRPATPLVPLAVLWATVSALGASLYIARVYGSGVGVVRVGAFDRALVIDSLQGTNQGVAGRTEGPVLLNSYRNPMSTHNAWSAVKRLAAKAEIPKRISPHSLRHSYITNLLDAGVSERDVMIGSGHTDPRMVIYYDRNRDNLERNPTHTLAAHIQRAG